LYDIRRPSLTLTPHAQTINNKTINMIRHSSLLILLVIATMTCSIFVSSSETIEVGDATANVDQTIQDKNDRTDATIQDAEDQINAAFSDAKTNNGTSTGETTATTTTINGGHIDTTNSDGSSTTINDGTITTVNADGTITTVENGKITTTKPDGTTTTVGGSSGGSYYTVTMTAVVPAVLAVAGGMVF
jgi:hypothetical protein